MAATNKTALVTGASSAKDGHDLILVSRSESELIQVAKKFENDYRIRTIVIVKELFEPNAVRELYDAVQVERHRGELPRQ
jgi:short-subunit dehydrogenase